MTQLNTVRQNLSRVWAGAKGRFTDYIAYQALEGAMLGIFDGFTAEQVYEAIVKYIEARDKGGEPPDFWSVNWGEYEEFRFQFRVMAHDPRYEKYLRLLDSENVLVWLSAKDARPDLASVILNTAGGIQWLDWQIGRIVKALRAPLEEEKVGGGNR